MHFLYSDPDFVICLLPFFDYFQNLSELVLNLDLMFWFPVDILMLVGLCGYSLLLLLQALFLKTQYYRRQLLDKRHDMIQSVDLCLAYFVLVR